MSISPISFRAEAPKVNNQPKEIPPYTTNTKPKTAAKTVKKSFWSEAGIKEPPPIAIGLLSASVWFGIGALMDKGISKMWKGYNYSAKTSMWMNGVFGLVMGTMDFFRARGKN